jgi:hypothetical protein
MDLARRAVLGVSLTAVVGLLACCLGGSVGGGGGGRGRVRGGVVPAVAVAVAETAGSSTAGERLKTARRRRPFVDRFPRRVAGRPPLDDEIGR